MAATKRVRGSGLRVWRSLGPAGKRPPHSERKQRLTTESRISNKECRSACRRSVRWVKVWASGLVRPSQFLVRHSAFRKAPSLLSSQGQPPNPAEGPLRKRNRGRGVQGTWHAFSAAAFRESAARSLDGATSLTQHYGCGVYKLGNVGVLRSGFGRFEGQPTFTPMRIWGPVPVFMDINPKTPDLDAGPAEPVMLLEVLPRRRGA